MKKAIILFLLAIPILSFSQKGKPDLKMGASRVNVTPEEPVLMSGYSGRKAPSSGVHDSLYATALYFTGGNTKTLIITSDLIGYSSSLADDIKADINAKTGIPANSILLSAVHNHGGPSVRVYESSQSPETDRYVAGLKEKLTVMAVNATKNPVPFKMGVGQGSCFYNVNRRAMFSDGRIGLGRDQTKPCDHTLSVVKFEDLNNKLIAVLINWPCHATASGSDNSQITGDWPGYAASFIRKQIGEDVIVAVTAGASGDINPIYGPGNKFNEISSVGYHVANESVKVLNTIKSKTVKELSSDYTTIKFPGKQPGKNTAPPTSFEDGPEVELRLTGMKIGSFVIEGISGELMNEIGTQVKKSSKYPNTIIVTHCNGSSGYICTDKAFPEGGYEIQTTRMKPGIEKPLVSKFLEQISGL